MTEMNFDKELDARGLNCPMPVVKARQEIGGLEVGQVLKITATDRGSIKDFQGWATVAKNIELLDQGETSEGETHLYIHYIKKAS